MTRSSTSRIAGASFLLYIGVGIASMVAPTGVRPALGTVMTFCALALGVGLYALTRQVDRDLAVFAMLCRVLEAGSIRSEITFAVGSAAFCWLLLKGRMLPRWLSGLGFASSAALSVLLLVQQAVGVSTDWSALRTWLIWFPLLVFELAFAGVLLADRLRLAPQPSEHPLPED